MYGWHKTLDKTLIYDEWYIVVQFEFDAHTHTHIDTHARRSAHIWFHDKRFLFKYQIVWNKLAGRSD